MNLAIDTTAGERERGSLEPLLCLPVERDHLIIGKVLAACLFMGMSLTLSLTAFSVVLRFLPLHQLGMTPNFGPAAAVTAFFVLIPFTLLGAWVRRRDPAFWPWIIYGLTLFAFSALLFAVHVPYGTFLHSAVALVPHAYLAGLIGIAVAVDAVGCIPGDWVICVGSSAAREAAGSKEYPSDLTIVGIIDHWEAQG